MTPEPENVTLQIDDIVSVAGASILPEEEQAASREDGVLEETHDVDCLGEQ